MFLRRLISQPEVFDTTFICRFELTGGKRREQLKTESNVKMFVVRVFESCFVRCIFCFRHATSSSLMLNSSAHLRVLSSLQKFSGKQLRTWVWNCTAATDISALNLSADSREALHLLQQKRHLRYAFTVTIETFLCCSSSEYFPQVFLHSIKHFRFLIAWEIGA